MPRLSPAHAPFLVSAALKYAAELQAKGWVAKDTAALGTAVGKLKDVGTEHENASDERLGLTDEKIIKANDLYHDCLVIQNAARLEYPGGKDAAGNARNITGRARFLLDAFPPRALKNKEGGHSCPPLFSIRSPFPQTTGGPIRPPDFFVRHPQIHAIVSLRRPLPPTAHRQGPDTREKANHR